MQDLDDNTSKISGEEKKPLYEEYEKAAVELLEEIKKHLEKNNNNSFFKEHYILFIVTAVIAICYVLVLISK